MPDHIFTPTWLCPTAPDRARVIDMERRLRAVGTGVLALVAVAVMLLTARSQIGWWPLVPFAVALGGFVVLGRRLDRSARPEYRVAAAWLLSVVALAVSIALTGGVLSPVLTWMAIPAVALPACFRMRGVWVGGTVTVALLTAAVATGDSGAPRDDVLTFGGAIVTVVAVVAMSVALMRSDLHHRTEALIDPLTGLLNRAALGRRIAELEGQASARSQPLALIVADVDDFKAINDERGHVAGDAVLREIADRFGSELRAYDAVYRTGGDEMVVLLPGATRASALELADSLRRAIELDPFGEDAIDVTMSFGVDACSSERFVYDELFASADRALYEAKAAGGGTVRPLPEPDQAGVERVA